MLVSLRYPGGDARPACRRSGGIFVAVTRMPTSPEMLSAFPGCCVLVRRQGRLCMGYRAPWGSPDLPARSVPGGPQAGNRLYCIIDGELRLRNPET